MSKLLYEKRGIEFILKRVILLVWILIFIAILVYAVLAYSKNIPVYEQAYSKQVALLIDAARSGTTINLDITIPIKIAEKNKVDENIESVFSISGNVVTVKLRDKGEGYSYSFFNNVQVIEKEMETATGYELEIKIS